MLLALGDGLLARLQVLLERGRSATWRSVSVDFAADQRLLERLRLLALLARLALGVGEELVRLFLGVEQRFLLAGFGVALGVLDDAERLLLGAADGFGGNALAVGDPDGEHGGRRHERDQDVDQVPDDRQHA